eukprot:TRINITY_DN3327_c1_g2_i1.p1 TRINITY_DN3327_c1_g2~~TRINITY_DN3327_c1_g2_i1.p1  ORF type:complete len:1089 (+),score=108.41 TRINITY_DN3327_c1_g2_i1:82-3348(+)
MAAQHGQTAPRFARPPPLLGCPMSSGAGSVGATPTVLLLVPFLMVHGTAAQPSFNQCKVPTGRFDVTGAQSGNGIRDKPCPVNVYSVARAGGSFLFACGSGYDAAVLCDGDGSGSGPAASCHPVGKLGCGFVVYDVVVTAAADYVYAACNNEVQRCEWDATTGTTSTCAAVTDALCPGSGFERGVELEGGNLVLSCYSDTTASDAGIFICSLSAGVVQGACQKRGEDPCGAVAPGTPATFSNSGLELDPPGLIVGCAGSGVAYCSSFSAGAGPSGCAAPANPSPCPSMTRAVARLPSGQTGVSCSSDGFRLCDSPLALPSAAPSADPSAPPTAEPTVAPSRQPSASPAGRPTAAPSNAPSQAPSGAPSVAPSRAPSGSPSLALPPPSVSPSEPPSTVPSSPSLGPSPVPSGSPRRPSAGPATARRTADPSRAPSAEPSAGPSAQPAAAPTGSPSHPSAAPTAAPTVPPGPGGSLRPTAAPTPLQASTAAPSAGPGQTLIAAPSGGPTEGPSQRGGPTGRPNQLGATSPPPASPADAEGVLAGTGAGKIAPAVGAALGGSGALVGYIAMAYDARACHQLGTPEALPRSLHFTQLEIAGSMELGCLLGNACIVAGVAAMSYLAVAMLRRWDEDGDGLLSGEELRHSYLRYVPFVREADYFDLAAVARHPNTILFAVVLTYQGICFAAIRLAMGSKESPWSRALGCVAAGATLAFPVWVYRKVSGATRARDPDGISAGQGRPLARVRQWDLPRPPPVLQWLVLSEQGDWVSCQRSPHWVNSWQTLVRRFAAQGAAGAAAAEPAAAWALGLVFAPPADSNTSCGHVRVAAGLVYFALVVYYCLTCPFRSVRETTVHIVALGHLTAAMLLLAHDFYTGDRNHRTVAALLDGAVWVVLGRAAIHLAGEALLLAMGWWAHSQRLEFGEERDDDSDITDIFEERCPGLDDDGPSGLQEELLQLPHTRPAASPLAEPQPAQRTAAAAPFSGGSVFNPPLHAPTAAAPPAAGCASPRQPAGVAHCGYLQPAAGYVPPLLPAGAASFPAAVQSQPPPFLGSPAPAAAAEQHQPPSQPLLRRATWPQSVWPHVPPGHTLL